MSRVEIHDGIARLARSVFPFHDEVAGHYRYYNGETALELVKSGPSEWTYRREERGNFYVEATSNTLLGVELVMLLLVGEVWRRREGLEQIDYAAADRRSGVSAEEDERGVWTFCWHGADGAVTVSGLDTLAAVPFERLAGKPVDGLVSSYRDPQGRPLLS